MSLANLDPLGYRDLLANKVLLVCPDLMARLGLKGLQDREENKDQGEKWACLVNKAHLAEMVPMEPKVTQEMDLKTPCKGTPVLGALCLKLLKHQVCPGPLDHQENQERLEKMAIKESVATPHFMTLLIMLIWWQDHLDLWVRPVLKGHQGIAEEEAREVDRAKQP